VPLNDVPSAAFFAVDVGTSVFYSPSFAPLQLRAARGSLVLAGLWYLDIAASLRACYATPHFGFFACAYATPLASRTHVCHLGKLPTLQVLTARARCCGARAHYPTVVPAAIACNAPLSLRVAAAAGMPSLPKIYLSTGFAWSLMQPTTANSSVRGLGALFSKRRLPVSFAAVALLHRVLLLVPIFLTKRRCNIPPFLRYRTRVLPTPRYRVGTVMPCR